MFAYTEQNKTNFQAMFAVLFAAFLFSAMFTLPKGSGTDLPWFQIVFIRYTGGLIFLLPTVWRWHCKGNSLKSSLGLLHIGRSIAGIGSVACVVIAASLIPLADVITISFSNGAIVLILAGIILGERVLPRHWASIIITIFGASLVASNSSNGGQSAFFSPAALIALLAACCMAIEIIVINDTTARNAALQSGKVHMINRVPPKVAGLVGRAPGVEVRSKSGPAQYVFNMFANTAPFDNNDLRLALKYAINREEMVEKILFGYGSIGNDTPINASYPLFSDDIPQHSYDPEKAAFHFKKSGHDGSILLRTSDNSFPGAPDASQLFQQSAKAAGIDIEVKREPNDGYWSEVWNAQPFCTSYWSGRPTQDAIFSTAFSSSADWNDTRFYHEDFDNMLVAARGELDEAKRKAIYRDMSLMIHEQGGQICPMFNDFIDATSDAVDGWAESKGFELMNQYAPSKMWLKA